MDSFIRIFIFLVIILIIAALLMCIKVPLPEAKSKTPSKKGKSSSNSKIDAGKMRSCPLCNCTLKNDEKVKSAVFPGKTDKLTHIFGCPYCYPVNNKHLRICPSCLQEVPHKGYVIARMFQKPGRTHVHVLGCTACRLG